MPDSHEQLFESSRGAREISSQMHSSSVNSRSALLLRENEKDKSDRSARALPEPWEYYREEWPRETLLEKMFPRFVPAGVEKEYNIFKHDHRGFLDSLRTATMVILRVGSFSTELCGKLFSKWRKFWLEIRCKLGKMNYSQN